MIDRLYLAAGLGTSVTAPSTRYETERLVP
jgi:hypothetical protein